MEDEFAMEGRSMKLRAWLMASAVVAICIPMGCDTFFVVKARVTDADSGEPIRSARVLLRLDRGFGEEDARGLTDADGLVVLHFNEPRKSWATLVIEAEGYSSWSNQFRGAPGEPVAIHLRPNGDIH